MLIGARRKQHGFLLEFVPARERIGQHGRMYMTDMRRGVDVEDGRSDECLSRGRVQMRQAGPHVLAILATDASMHYV